MSWLLEVERLLAARPIRRIDAGGALLPAAVLVPLIVAEGQLWLVFTRRAAGAQAQAGELAFPGGPRQSGDDDLVATALRESAAELGVLRDQIIVLGALDDVAAGSGHVVSPVVGALPYPFPVAPRTERVDAVIPFPIAFLAQPTMVEEAVEEIAGTPVASPVLHYGGRRVGGPPARILLDLLGRLSGSPPPPVG